MRETWRMIDANVNRAREAARTLEDVARFALDDAAMSERLKSLRHAIQEEANRLDAGRLLASRDTAGDVGTTISAETEGLRGSLAGVAASAEGRLTESLRAIEEAMKVVGRDASTLERLRYQAYDLCRDLRLALGTGRCPQWRLCVIVTEGLCRHHAWDHVAEAAIEGGADCLQLREKGMADRKMLARAKRLVEIARAGGAHAIVNDRADIAMLAGADGVHVGDGDLAIRDVRRLAGFSIAIGASTHAMEEARAAVLAGADYCGVGSMFPTGTKAGARVSGPTYLRAYLADPILSQRPCLAIGGIQPENVKELARDGCPGVAVSSCVCAAEEPAVVCRALREALDQGASSD